MRILISVLLISVDVNLYLQQIEVRPCMENLSSAKNLSNFNRSQRLKYFKNLNVPVQKEVPLSSICWSYCCDGNAIAHSLHGNRRFGYQIGFWNCRKKLISNNSFETHKLTR